MKVLLLSRYGRLGASSRIRHYQYLPYLAEAGVETCVSPLLGDWYIADLYGERKTNRRKVAGGYRKRFGQLLKAGDFDLLWIQREIFPWVPAWAESWIRHLGVPFLVDFDDAVFHGYDLHPNPLVRFLLGKKIDAFMANADLVTAGNEYLAGRARLARARRVELLPTVVDLDRYRTPHKSEGRDEDRPFTIGWIGTPSTVEYLEEVQGALAEVARQRPVRMMVVGGSHPPLQEIPIVTHPWSEDSEVDRICSFDVGIMPLPDRPWERGKCGYKLIQYMACGLPVVASPVGVNGTIVDHGENGFLAATPSQWIEALLTLIDNRDLARRMGKAGRQKVAREYCLQVTAPRLAGWMAEIARKRVAR